MTGFQNAGPLWPGILGFSLRTSSKIFEMIFWGFSDVKGLSQKSRTWISGPKIMTPYLHWPFCLWLINLMSTDIMKNTFVSLVLHLDVGIAFWAPLYWYYSFLISGAVLRVENKAVSCSQESLQGTEGFCLRGVVLLPRLFNSWVCSTYICEWLDHFYWWMHFEQGVFMSGWRLEG